MAAEALVTLLPAVIAAVVGAVVGPVLSYYLGLRRENATKERVSQLEPELRSQVQERSYGARSNLIEAPLKELDLDITPRVDWVRDPRLVEPEPISEKTADIVAAFASARRRLLIVGEPGSGKTMAAYCLIEHLDKTEGDKRIPLLVNLSAGEAQDDFEAFLVDYLCSSVGYEVRERAVASTFISSLRYALILDGLDEIPAGLRQQFSERLDEFLRGLPGEVGVVVTCRTQEYEELRANYATGLGLVQAVEILPLTSEQLDSALTELAKVDEDWGALLSQRHLTACQRARGVLSNPLFLNLAVAGRLRPRQLLECAEEQEVHELVLDTYLNRTLTDQRHYEAEDARRYLSWIARFLNGDEVSPFGLKTADYTVFDLADLTPPDPPWRYRSLVGLLSGLVLGLVLGPISWLVFGLAEGLDFYVLSGLISGLVMGLVVGLPTGRPFERTAVSSRLILVWPLTGRQLLNFLRRAGRGLVLGLLLGLGVGLVFGLVEGLIYWLAYGLFFELSYGLRTGLLLGLGAGLDFGLVLALGFGLLETRSVLTSRTPEEARSRSLRAALTWLVLGLVGGAVFGPIARPVVGPSSGLVLGLFFGLGVGLFLALPNGGWFVLLQEVAHRRLARAGNLPPRPYDFLE